MNPSTVRSHVGEHLGVTLPEERDQLHQFRVARHHVLLDDRARAERQETDHRADLQTERLAVRKPEHVVVEAVLLVPHVVPLVAGLVHRERDPDDGLEEPERDLLVDLVVLGEDEGHLQHALAVEGHPRRAVRLLERPAGRQLRAAVEDADVVEAQEPAGEDVLSWGSLRLTHQLKLSSSPWNERARNLRSSRPRFFSIL